MSFSDMLIAQMNGGDEPADPTGDAGESSLPIEFDPAAAAAGDAGDEGNPNTGDPAQADPLLPPAPATPDPQAIQFAIFQQIQQLQQTDPAAAAQLLQQQAAYLQQQAQPQQPQQPQLPDWLNVEPATDAEAAALRFAQESYFKNLEVERLLQSQRETTARAQIDRTFEELAGKYKREIPIEQRQKVAELCVKTGCVDLEVAYRSVLFDAAQQAAMEKGQRIARQKSQPAAGVPGGRQTPAPAAGEKPKGLHAHFEQAWSQHSN